MKKYVLKAFHIIICLMLILSFAGCGNSKEPSPVIPEKPRQKLMEEKTTDSLANTSHNLDTNEQSVEEDATNYEKSLHNEPEEPISENGAKPSQTDNREKADSPESYLEPVSKKCTIAITCKEILSNTEKLDSSKSFSIPSDGIILASTENEFEEGASVFDILLQTVKKNHIHMEYSKTPGTKSVYIEAIANIYEFDCGELSGWMYIVNGTPPMVSASDYIVADGDEIEFIYVCSFFE